MLKTIATVSAVLLILSGCDAMMPTRDSAPARGDATRENVEAAMEEASTSPPPAPAAIPQRAEPAAVATQPSAKRFNLNSEDTPAQAFFMALVDQTRHNIVVHPEVAGNISLMLQDVTVEEVLDVVSEVFLERKG